MSGSLSVLKALDREEQDSYNLTIVAEDHGTPQHSTTQVLSVQVIDVNDEAPWFELSEYEVQIRENRPAGSTVLTVSATDRDQGERILFSQDFLYCQIFILNTLYPCLNHLGCYGILTGILMGSY